MNEENSEWISFSDIMTTLMLIFLLISILTINQVQNKYKQPLLDFLEIKKDLYDDLKQSFESKEKELGILIEKDLTIKFNDDDTLFDQDSVFLKNEFKKKLDVFFPIYFSVINKERYKNEIKEIRIEGHTANYSPRYNTDIALIELSQGRSNSIFKYILNSNYYKEFELADRKKFLFWFSSNGFGKGKSIDDDNEYVYDSKGEVSMHSRRVEFKLITGGEELINKILEIDQ